ncbi:MAG: hypothetical protein C4555_06410 [Dehalococcoidia bacterium]|nr:MAG: hypothetical protein C4555_06410 [Dehalococcoidia bacterium]
MTPNMKIEQKGTQIVITISAGVDGEPPRPPKTNGEWDKGRKGWMIATTGGNEALPQRVNGRRLVLGLNLFTQDAPQKGKRGEESDD